MKTNNSKNQPTLKLPSGSAVSCYQVYSSKKDLKLAEQRLNEIKRTNKYGINNSIVQQRKVKQELRESRNTESKGFNDYICHTVYNEKSPSQMNVNNINSLIPHSSKSIENTHLKSTNPQAKSKKPNPTNPTMSQVNGIKPQKRRQISLMNFTPNYAPKSNKILNRPPLPNRLNNINNINPNQLFLENDTDNLNNYPTQFNTLFTEENKKILRTDNQDDQKIGTGNNVVNIVNGLNGFGTNDNNVEINFNKYEIKILPDSKDRKNDDDNDINNINNINNNINNNNYHSRNKSDGSCSQRNRFKKFYLKSNTEKERNVSKEYKDYLNFNSNTNNYYGDDQFIHRDNIKIYSHTNSVFNSNINNNFKNANRNYNNNSANNDSNSNNNVSNNNNNNNNHVNISNQLSPISPINQLENDNGINFSNNNLSNFNTIDNNNIEALDNNLANLDNSIISKHEEDDLKDDLKTSNLLNLITSSNDINIANTNTNTNTKNKQSSNSIGSIKGKIKENNNKDNNNKDNYCNTVYPKSSIPDTKKKFVFLNKENDTNVNFQLKLPRLNSSKTKVKSPLNCRRINDGINNNNNGLNFALNIGQICNSSRPKASAHSYSKSEYVKDNNNNNNNNRKIIVKPVKIKTVFGMDKLSISNKTNIAFEPVINNNKEMDDKNTNKNTNKNVNNNGNKNVNNNVNDKKEKIIIDADVKKDKENQLMIVNNNEINIVKDEKTNTVKDKENKENKENKEIPKETNKLIEEKDHLESEKPPSKSPINIQIEHELEININPPIPSNENKLNISIKESKESKEIPQNDEINPSQKFPIERKKSIITNSNNEYPFQRSKSNQIPPSKINNLCFISHNFDFTINSNNSNNSNNKNQQINQENNNKIIKNPSNDNKELIPCSQSNLNMCICERPKIRNTQLQFFKVPKEYTLLNFNNNNNNNNNSNSINPSRTFKRGTNSPRFYTSKFKDNEAFVKSVKTSIKNNLKNREIPKKNNENNNDSNDNIIIRIDNNSSDFADSQTEKDIISNLSILDNNKPKKNNNKINKSKFMKNNNNNNNNNNVDIDYNLSFNDFKKDLENMKKEENDSLISNVNTENDNNNNSMNSYKNSNNIVKKTSSKFKTKTKAKSQSKKYKRNGHHHEKTTVDKCSNFNIFFRQNFNKNNNENNNEINDKNNDKINDENNDKINENSKENIIPETPKFNVKSDPYKINEIKPSNMQIIPKNKSTFSNKNQENHIKKSDKNPNNQLSEENIIEKNYDSDDEEPIHKVSRKLSKVLTYKRHKRTKTVDPNFNGLNQLNKLQKKLRGTVKIKEGIIKDIKINDSNSLNNSNIYIKDDNNNNINNINNDNKSESSKSNSDEGNFNNILDKIINKNQQNLPEMNHPSPKKTKKLNDEINYLKENLIQDNSNNDDSLNNNNNNNVINIKNCNTMNVNNANNYYKELSRIFEQSDNSINRKVTYSRNTINKRKTNIDGFHFQIGKMLINNTEPSRHEKKKSKTVRMMDDLNNMNSIIKNVKNFLTNEGSNNSNKYLNINLQNLIKETSCGNNKKNSKKNLNSILKSINNVNVNNNGDKGFKKMKTLNADNSNKIDDFNQNNDNNPSEKNGNFNKNTLNNTKMSKISSGNVNFFHTHYAKIDEEDNESDENDKSKLCNNSNINKKDLKEYKEFKEFKESDPESHQHFTNNSSIKSPKNTNIKNQKSFTFVKKKTKNAIKLLRKNTVEINNERFIEKNKKEIRFSLFNYVLNMEERNSKDIKFIEFLKEETRSKISEIEDNENDQQELLLNKIVIDCDNKRNVIDEDDLNRMKKHPVYEDINSNDGIKRNYQYIVNKECKNYQEIDKENLENFMAGQVMKRLGIYVSNDDKLIGDYFLENILNIDLYNLIYQNNYLEEPSLSQNPTICSNNNGNHSNRSTLSDNNHTENHSHNPQNTTTTTKDHSHNTTINSLVRHFSISLLQNQMKSDKASSHSKSKQKITKKKSNPVSLNKKTFIISPNFDFGTINNNFYNNFHLLEFSNFKDNRVNYLVQIGEDNNNNNNNNNIIVINNNNNNNNNNGNVNNNVSVNNDLSLASDYSRSTNNCGNALSNNNVNNNGNSNNNNNNSVANNKRKRVAYLLNNNNNNNNNSNSMASNNSSANQKCIMKRNRGLKGNNSNNVNNINTVSSSGHSNNQSSNYININPQSHQPFPYQPHPIIKTFKRLNTKSQTQVPKDRYSILGTKNKFYFRNRDIEGNLCFERDQQHQKELASLMTAQREKLFLSPFKQGNNILSMKIQAISPSKAQGALIDKESTLFRTHEIKSNLLKDCDGVIDSLFFYIKDGAVRGFIDTFEKYKVDIESKDKLNNTFLNLAVQCECTDIVEYLLNNGANPNTKNRKLNTPLHYALSYQNFYLCDLLLKFGADENSLNITGYRPWQCLDASHTII